MSGGPAPAEGCGALTAAIRDAVAAGRAVAPRGSGQWWADAARDAAPLDLGTLAPAGVERVDGGDLVATAGAACPLDALEVALRAHGTWLALDPPGAPDRTLGGALAAGGAGPLAAGFGPPRDQVIGMTFVAGNGTAVTVGGRVVKNVAGFDLAKAVIGAHGGFGAIARVHLRLRAVPEADRSRAWSGSLPRVADAAAGLLAAGALPAAGEVVSPTVAVALGLPAEEWALLIRAQGTAAGTAEELDAAGGAAADLAEAPLATEAWGRWRAVMGEPPVVVRIGAEPSAWPDAVRLVQDRLGAGCRVSVTAPRGTVRAAGEAGAGVLLALRAEAARRGWPMTLERAGAALRSGVGVWGALAPGARVLTERLRATFDPAGVFAVPLLAT